MPFKENLVKATTLKNELDSFRPLSPEVEKRIMQKFRLDWNYNSSHIEGNQLTYGETKALILFGQTAQAKPLKDHLEMTGHDEAIKEIEEVVRQERPLTESFIRELHTLILKEPYERAAKTEDGIPTVRHIAIGQYKTSPNHVLTKTGEMFYFASPEETPAKMEELMVWYNENLNNKDTNAVLFATEFHYKFIRIHPFDDGNGRMARLLMNLILMQKGYPPAIIKSEDKEEYYNALQQADADQIEYFFNYLCIQVIRSLELMIKGAKGEEFDEDNDLDKKLTLIRKKISEEELITEATLEFHKDLFLKHFNLWLKSFLEESISTFEKFNEFFRYERHDIYFENIKDYIFVLNESAKTLLYKFEESLPTKNFYYPINNQNQITFKIKFEQFIKNIQIDYYNQFTIIFNRNDFYIEYQGEELIRKSNNDFLTAKESKKVINKIAEDIYKFIESKV
jgi:Fic family protein